MDPKVVNAISDELRSNREANYDREADELTHARAMDDDRARLEDGINDALAGVRQASSALADLIGPTFDVEYADTDRGPDMQEHARQALLHLRAMQARQYKN